MVYRPVSEQEKLFFERALIRHELEKAAGWFGPKNALNEANKALNPGLLTRMRQKVRGFVSRTKPNVNAAVVPTPPPVESGVKDMLRKHKSAIAAGAGMGALGFAAGRYSGGEKTAEEAPAPTTAETKLKSVWIPRKVMESPARHRVGKTPINFSTAAAGALGMASTGLTAAGALPSKLTNFSGKERALLLAAAASSGLASKALHDGAADLDSRRRLYKTYMQSGVLRKADEQVKSAAEAQPAAERDPRYGLKALAAGAGSLALYRSVKKDYAKSGIDELRARAVDAMDDMKKFKRPWYDIGNLKKKRLEKIRVNALADLNMANDAFHAKTRLKAIPSALLGGAAMYYGIKGLLNRKPSESQATQDPQA